MVAAVASAAAAATAAEFELSRDCESSITFVVVSIGSPLDGPVGIFPNVLELLFTCVVLLIGFAEA